MESNKKYSTPDNEGLQIVDRNDFPEVVPYQQPATLAHRGSIHNPEVYNTPVDESQAQKQPLYYPDHGHSQSGSEYASPPPQYRNNEKQGLAGVGGVESGGDKKSSRICGMKRRVFIIVMAIVIFVIIIAAVLGGVLGTVLGNNNNNNNNGDKNSSSASNATTGPPPLPRDDSGLAIIQPAGDSNVYSYYQAANGSIWENQYATSPWTNSTSGTPTTRMVTAGDVLELSPIAAITYTQQNNVYRQIFYFDSNGVVTTTNVTGNNNWTTPYNIFSTAASAPNTPALTACVSTTSSGGLNGIRLYYGGTSSSGNFIQEAGLDFSEAGEYLIWHQWFTFTGSDAGSGAACALLPPYSHVYMFNTTLNNMVQWSWNFALAPNTSWAQGNTLSSNTPMVKGSPMAATSDGVNTDYIFYSSNSNNDVDVTRVLWTSGGFSSYLPNTPSPATFENFLAASYINGSAIVANQNGSDILYTSVNRIGVSSSA